MMGDGRAVEESANVLTVLNVVLRKAVEWNVPDLMSCTIPHQKGLFANSRPEPDFK